MHDLEERSRFRGVARDPDGQTGALLVARGTLCGPDEDDGIFERIEVHRAFEIELPDGRRVRALPDADTVLWLPLTNRVSTVAELRARYPTLRGWLTQEPETLRLMHGVTLVHDGDPIEVVARPVGVRFVPDTGGPREAPRTEPDGLRIDAIGVGRHAARDLRRVVTGEHRGMSALGLGLMVAGAALVALTAPAGRASFLWVPTGLGLGIVISGAFTWWLGLRAPRSSTGLEVLALVSIFAPFLSWLLYSWPALAVPAFWFWHASAPDASVLRTVRRALRRGEARIARVEELPDLEPRAGLLVTGQVPYTGSLPRRGTAIFADQNRAVLLVPPGRDLPLDRWLRRRAIVIALLLTNAALGAALLLSGWL